MQLLPTAATNECHSENGENGADAIDNISQFHSELSDGSISNGSNDNVELDNIEITAQKIVPSQAMEVKPGHAQTNSWC